MIPDMEKSPRQDFSLDRPLTEDEDQPAGYDLWFDLPPREGDATTTEFQTLCQGAMVVGFVACRMGWAWATTLKTFDHLSAPSDGYLLIELTERAFYNERFRRALGEAVSAVGFDPYKVRLTDERRGNVYVLAHGLPALAPVSKSTEHARSGA